MKRPILSDIDPKIRRIVALFWEHDIDTFSSCQGGSDHGEAMPTICYYGDADVVTICREHDISIWELRYIRPIAYDQPSYYVAVFPFDTI